MDASHGRKRVVIAGVTPQIEGGRFPIKRIVGDTVTINADIFADGHDTLAAHLLYRRQNASEWIEVPMTPLGNDRWQASFTVDALCGYEYTLTAWVDSFQSWHHDLLKRIEAKQDVGVDLLIGAQLVREAACRAAGSDAAKLTQLAQTLGETQSSAKEKLRHISSRKALALINRYPEREFATTYAKTLRITVDRERARFSAWYEMFPRSASAQPDRHATFKDCEKRLPYIAEMGFDVLYFPPIHPIGEAYRKGQNNAPSANQGEPGSPWAIGSELGGHKAIHPQLGTLEDFRHLVGQARGYGIEIALDIAYQCSPDHPYVTEHPQWFRQRPDGTIQYAENPPKKYQDIYPFDFECQDWQSLWQELKSIVEFWIEQGVNILRVDNPHTKPFPFWEWLITDVKSKHPETIFLAEAFTRPKIMYRLAQLGFTQSYTYFTWRNTKGDLTEYFSELTRKGGVSEFFRPNLWPNTPDILNEYLQSGARPAFMARLILAATLGANYGIYGPAFELGINTPKAPDSEEYLNSEKYEVKHWDIDHPSSLKDIISRVNTIRKAHRALRRNKNLVFHRTDNPQLICYSKHTDDFSDIILTIVNLDSSHRHSGWVELDLQALGLNSNHPYQAHDLLTEARYLWEGSHNFVELDPHSVPAHIFQIHAQVHTEQDFDYYW